MKNSIKLPAKASIWYMISGLLGKACAVLTTPFFTRILSREEYGSFNLYMTVLGGASVVCSSFSTGSAVYKGLSNFKDKKDAFLKAVLGVSMVFTLLVCILLFAFSSFLGVNGAFLPIISLQLFCDGILGVFYSGARYSYRYKEVCGLSVVGFILPPLLALLVLLTIGGGFEVRVTSLLAVSLGSAAYALIRLFKSKEKTGKGMAKYAIKQSLPLLPHSISNSLTSQADKLLITALLGAGALAEYSVGHSLGISLAFLVGTLGGALNPWIIRRLESKGYAEIAKINTYVFSGLSAAAVFLCAVSPEVISILAPREYSGAAGAVLPVALSVLPSFLISTITVALIYDEKGKYTVILSLVGAGLSVILNYMFIRSFGYLGAGYALLLSQWATAALGIYYLKRIGLNEIFCIRSISKSFLLGFGLCILVRVFQSSPALRILVLIAPAVALLNALFGLKRLIYEKSLPA